MILGMFAAGAASASPRTLECSSGVAYEKFSATLDDSHYDAGSGYFEITKAWFLDNYLNIQLNCTGYDLKSLDCIGFAFGMSGRIEEVTLRESHGEFFASLGTLKGPPMTMHRGPWPSTVRQMLK